MESCGSHHERRVGGECVNAESEGQRQRQQAPRVGSAHCSWETPLAIDVLRAEIARFTPSELPGVTVPKKKAVLAKTGYVSTKWSARVPALEEEWAEHSKAIPSRELLNLYWRGGLAAPPSETSLSAFRVDEHSSIYVVRSDFGEEGEFLIAATDQAADEIDATLLEDFIRSNGRHFGLDIFGSPPDGGRCVMTADELAPIVLEALGGSDFHYSEAWDEVFPYESFSDEDDESPEGQTQPDRVTMVREYLDLIL